jgi:VTC domain.
MCFMRHDEHGSDGQYFIRSLYLDDIYMADFHQKNEGRSRRRKYRIRIYDNSDSLIKFEIKDKFDSYISKKSSVITPQQCDSILRGDFQFVSDMMLHDRANAESEKNRALRMGYIDCACRILRPQVVVDYDREVFICDEGNVRMTFDMNLRAGQGTGNIFDPHLPTVPAYENGKMILEVKYDDYLPQFIRRMLRSKKLSLWQSAESKYSLCCIAQSNYLGKVVL